jgi:hypothetical protein
MPSRATRRRQHGGLGGPSQHYVDNLKEHVQAKAKEDAEEAATEAAEQVPPEERTEVYNQKYKEAFDALSFIDGQVTYEGSIWAKSFGSERRAVYFNPSNPDHMKLECDGRIFGNNADELAASNARGDDELSMRVGDSGDRRPVYLNPKSTKSLHLECDFNPGILSGKYNFTIRGNDGDTLHMAYQKATSWNLDKGKLSLAGVMVGAQRLRAFPLLMLAPLELVPGSIGDQTKSIRRNILNRTARNSSNIISKQRAGRRTRRHRRQSGGGPSQAKLEELKAAVNAAALKEAEGDLTSPVYHAAKYIEGQVGYEGSIWAKSLGNMTGSSGRRPLYFKQSAPGFHFECDINPGVRSTLYNYTIRGNDGDTLMMAYLKGDQWGLGKSGSFSSILD